MRFQFGHRTSVLWDVDSGSAADSETDSVTDSDRTGVGLRRRGGSPGALPVCYPSGSSHNPVA